MSDRKFDLGDYVEVKDRIRLFYEQFPDGRLTTSDVQLLTDPDGEQRVLVKALAYRTPDDPVPAAGHSWMVLPGSTSYTRGSEVENTETSAWGRAIGALGIGIAGGIASAQEVRNKEGQPVTPNRNVSPPDEGAAETRTTHRDGLVAKAITSGTQDFELRLHEERGYTLPFRVKEGRLNQIVLAQGELALQLADHRDQVLDQRITVWGHYEPQTFPDKKRPGEAITYNVLFAERVKLPDGTDLPALREDAIPVVDGQVPAFDLKESARLDAEEAARAGA